MRNNMINVYIYYVIYVILFISIPNSILGMPHQQRPAYKDHAYPKPQTSYQQQEQNKQKAIAAAQKKLQEELKALAEKTSQHKDSKKEKLEKNPLFQALKKTFGSINYEGLPGSTKVKTESGHRTIDELKIGDMIACYDTKNAKETCCKVINAQKLSLTKHIQIIIGDQTLKVAHKHEFYVKSLDKYVTALDLKDNFDLRKLVNENIQDVKEVKEPLAVIRICVDPNHNFYITEHDILVHNFIPFVLQVGYFWGAGTAWSWNVLAPTIAAITTLLTYWLGNKLTGQDKKSPPPQPYMANAEQQQNADLYAQRADGTYFKADRHNQPTQSTPRNNRNEKKSPPQRPNKDKEETIITTKIANEEAEKLGFEKTNYFSQGRPVYKKGNQYITPDRKAHNGGFWKMADSVKNLSDRTKRMGTYDRFLNRIGD